MSDARIYLKDSDLKNIPASFLHPRLPLLFAESGLIPTSKGKKKKCFIAVHYAGIGFFRPKALGHSKSAAFFSTFAISEINWLDAKRREIVARNGSKFFVCDHADEAITFLLSSRALLFSGSVDATPIQLRGFPSALQAKQLGFAGQDGLSQLRYLTWCYRYDAPVADDLLQWLKKLGPGMGRTLFLDESICKNPGNIKCLVRPICQVRHFTSVHLRSIAPYAACRMVHYLIKSNPGIHSVVFEGYSRLIPAQLRMEKLSAERAISFVFLKCPLSEGDFIRLIEELAKFEGEYQRLTIDGISLTAEMLKQLFRELNNARTFRSLEVLELDRIDSHAIPPERVVKRVGGLMRHSRFLNRISLAQWAVPMSFQLPIFMTTNVLAELVLTKHDMSHTFSPCEIPPNVRVINLSQCHFTMASLREFLEVVSRAHTPLTLTLQDIVMPDAHWHTLFGLLPSFPRLASVQELDWSGNRLPVADIPAFVNYFFSSNNIKFLGLDRIFRTGSSQDLAHLLELIPKNSLWGLSVRGSTEANFSGSFRHLLAAVDMADLSILHVDGQKMTDADAPFMLAYAERNKKLVELSCDDTNLSSDRLFLEFYEKLARLGVRALGRPFIDMQRLFAPDSSIVDGVRAAFRGHPPAALPLARALAMAAGTVDGLPDLAERFPGCFTVHDSPDRWVLDHRDDPAASIEALLSSEDRSEEITLADAHAKRVGDPETPPWYSPPGIADGISRTDSGIASGESFDGELDIPEVYLQPLAETKEMRAALRLHARLPPEKENEPPTQPQIAIGAHDEEEEEAPSGHLPERGRPPFALVAQRITLTPLATPNPRELFRVVPPSVLPTFRFIPPVRSASNTKKVIQQPPRLQLQRPGGVSGRQKSPSA
jgi:hypothetical protein